MLTVSSPVQLYQEIIMSLLANRQVSSQLNSGLVNHLFFVGDERIITRMIKIMADIDLILPPLIGIVPVNGSIYRNLLPIMRLVELSDSKQFSGEFGGKPDVIANDIVKIHKHPR